jgi:hypothetical protein
MEMSERRKSMTDGLEEQVQILNPHSQQAKIDEMTLEVVALLEQVSLEEGELIGIVELSMLDTISNLAGYVHEMQQQILNVLGAIPDLNAPTALDFSNQYIEDYTLLRIARTRSLLMGKIPPEVPNEVIFPLTDEDEEAHDEAAKAREAAVHDALDAERDDGG